MASVALKIVGVVLDRSTLATFKDRPTIDGPTQRQPPGLRGVMQFRFNPMDRTYRVKTMRAFDVGPVLRYAAGLAGFVGTD